jgi:hypothetical protein
VTGNRLLRRRFAIGDRAFAVLGEPWFDLASGTWQGRLVFIPVDRSLPRCVVSGAVCRAAQRDELLRRLDRVSDREVARAFRAIALPLARRR